MDDRWRPRSALRVRPTGRGAGNGSGDRVGRVRPLYGPAARGKGTGFALSKPNWIVTAKHVISGQPPHNRSSCCSRGPRPARPRPLRAPASRRGRAGGGGDTRCRAPFMPSQRGPISSELLYVGYQPSMSDRNAGRYIAFVRACIPTNARRADATATKRSSSSFRRLAASPAVREAPSWRPAAPSSVSWSTASRWRPAHDAGDLDIARARPPCPPNARGHGVRRCTRAPATSTGWRPSL